MSASPPADDICYDSEPERELWHSQRDLHKWTTGESSTSDSLGPCLNVDGPTTSRWFNRRGTASVVVDLTGDSSLEEPKTGVIDLTADSSRETATAEAESSGSSFVLPPPLDLPNFDLAPIASPAGSLKSRASESGSSGHRKRRSSGTKSGRGLFSSASKLLRDQVARGQTDHAGFSDTASSNEGSPRLLVPASDDEMDLDPVTGAEAEREVPDSSPMRLDKVDMSRFRYQGRSASNASLGRENLFRAGSYVNAKTTAIAYPDPMLPAAQASKGKGKAKKSAIETETESNVASTSNASASEASPSVYDIPSATLRRLAVCPSCEHAWTSYKAPSNKLKHIAKCAKKHVLSPAIVLDRVSAGLERADEDERLRADEEQKGMTLFDRHVKMKNVEVNVVGVDRRAHIGKGKVRQTKTQVQTEMDDKRKKKKLGQVVPIFEGSAATVDPAGWQSHVPSATTSTVGDWSRPPAATQTFTPSKLAAAATHSARKMNGSARPMSVLESARLNGRTAVTDGKGLWNLACGGEEADPSRSAVSTASASSASEASALEGRTTNTDAMQRSPPTTPPVSSVLPAAILIGSSPSSQRRLYATSARTRRSSDSSSDLSSSTKRRPKEASISVASSGSSTDGKRRRTAGPSVAPAEEPLKSISLRAASSEVEDVSEMPEYTSWTIEQLLAESERLGFSTPLKTKRALVRRAEDGWKSRLEKLSGLGTNSPSGSEVDSTRRKAQPRTTSPEGSDLDSGDASASPAAPRKRSRRASASSTSDSDSERSTSSREEALAAVDLGGDLPEEELPDFKSWPIAQLRAAHAKLDYPTEPKTKSALVRRVTKAWLEDHDSVERPEGFERATTRATAEMVGRAMPKVCMDDRAFYERILRYEVSLTLRVLPSAGSDPTSSPSNSPFFEPDSKLSLELP